MSSGLLKLFLMGRLIGALHKRAGPFEFQGEDLGAMLFLRKHKKNNNKGGNKLFVLNQPKYKQFVFCQQMSLELVRSIFLKNHIFP